MPRWRKVVAARSAGRTRPSSLGERPIQPQTRYFLTDNRLIMRLDKSKSVETKGNGFIISEKGRLLLTALS